MKLAWIVVAWLVWTLTGCLDGAQGGGVGTDTQGGGATADTFVDNGPPFVPLDDLGPETLATHPLFVTALCAGGILRVDYTSTLSVGTANVFSAQLSDPAGSFAAFINIGSFKSRTSGTIYATVPAELAAGDHYRVRVIASSPYTVGSDNGADLGVGALPRVDVHRMTPSPANAVVGEQVGWGYGAFGEDAPKAGTTYHWSFGPTATPATSAAKIPRIIYTAPGSPTTTLTLTTSQGCSASATTVSDHYDGLVIYGCSVAIPKAVTVVKGGFEPTYEDDDFWVCPGGNLQMLGGGGHTVYVATGGSVTHPGGGSTLIYVQTGGSATVSPGGSTVVVQADGASVSSDILDQVDVLSCPTLTFDLSQAPSPGCD